jgi:putative transposase
MVHDVDVESARLPPRSPNLNAHAERFVRTIKESCLERMILFGEESLRTAISNFVAIITPSATTRGWPTG